ncbi:hypothetical protein Bbelb_290890 [Branchiostoma belcheri]|nr:hypothetical protein Bbelb_290890 [Branchiostoma belcheri]
MYKDVESVYGNSYQLLSRLSIYTKLSRERVHTKLSRVSVYTRLSYISFYTKLSRVSIYTKLSRERVHTKLSRVSVYTKLSREHVYTKLSREHVNTKLSQVSVYTKLSQVRVYTKLSQVSVYIKLFQVSVYTKLSKVRVYTKLSQVRVYTKLSRVSVYTKLSQVIVHTKLSQIVVNNETALSVATELQVITTQAETLSYSDVNLIIATVQKIVNASATEQIGDSLLTTVDNLIKVNVTVLQQSQEEMRGPTRAVQALETFADTVILTTDTYTAVRPGVALHAADISPEELDKGQGFAFFLSGNDSNSLTEGDVTSFTTEDGGDIPQTADTSISLPPNISNMIQIKNMSDVRLSYTLYNSSSLFVQLSQGAVGPSQGAVGPSQSTTVHSQGAVGTRIIGGRIAGRRVKDLPEPVLTTFVPLPGRFVPEDMRKVKCVFWDFDADAWSTEGCESKGQKMGRYTCACNHLTNFAIIFDVSGEGFGDHEKPLEVITIVGCVVSIVCLVLTLFSFIITRRDKRRTRTGHAKNQRHAFINLCVALLAALVIFLTGINRTASPIGCKVVAALLHYFLLAALMWMAVEAVNLYRAVVQVFDSVSENFVIKAGAVAWAGLILLFNLLIFILVMRKLVREEKKQKELRGIGADAIEVDREWITRQIRRACSIMALFGLTWVFGFLVIDDARTVFAYLFCIFNTLQGLFIFIFHCVMREDMTKWRKKLTCWKFICTGKKKQGQYQVDEDRFIIPLYPAHAREIRRVLVASMDFRAPRVRPRIFPYTPGFVLAVHVHGNLRPAHLACVGERLTIRGQHRNEPANRQEEGLSESSEKKERKATAVTQKRARLEANRQTAHPGSDLKARAPTTQAGPAALPPGVHPAPSTPLRPDCDHNRHQHHAIPQTDMGQFVLPG